MLQQILEQTLPCWIQASVRKVEKHTSHGKQWSESADENNKGRQQQHLGKRMLRITPPGDCLSGGRQVTSVEEQILASRSESYISE